MESIFESQGLSLPDPVAGAVRAGHDRGDGGRYTGYRLSRGSVPEVVADGISGFLVNDTDEMVEALGRLDEIDPAACRRYVQDKFSVGKCTDGYEKVYNEVAVG